MSSEAEILFKRFLYPHGELVCHRADRSRKGVIIGRAIHQDENGSFQRLYFVSVPDFGIVEASEIELVQSVEK